MCCRVSLVGIDRIAAFAATAGTLTQGVTVRVLMFDENAIEAHTTPMGLQRYRLPAVFPQTNKHRYISSDTPAFAIHKATLQEMLWARQHEARAAVKHKKLGLEMNGKRPDLKARQKHKIAEARTELAREELRCAYQPLPRVLSHPVDFSWTFFKQCAEFPVAPPEKPVLPAPPVKPVLPREPSPTDPLFQPQLDPMDKLMRSRREQKEQEAAAKFEATHKQWEQLCLRMRRLFHDQTNQHKASVRGVQERYQAAMQQWESARAYFQREREACIRIVAQKEADYLEHEPHAVLDYFDMVLASSVYPTCFPQSFDLDYDAKNRLLVVEYLLPPLRVLPRLAKVMYNEGDNTFHDIILPDEERNALYAHLLYELPLRSLHELFSTDTAVSLGAVLFRGYLFLEENKETGKPPACVLSLHADRATFATIDLYHTNAAAIFDDLGGEIRPLE